MPQKLTFTSYAGSPEYSEPDQWLKRISAYTGILERLALEHEVIGIERIDYEGQLKQNDVQYFFVRQKKKIVYFPKRIHQLIRQLQPDVVFINGFIFPLQLIQLKLTLGKRSRIIVIHRAERPFKGLKKYLQKIADKCVNAYLFTSAEFGKEWIENGIISDAKKIHEVIQASSDFKFENKSEALQNLSVSGSPVFLWVGRLDTNKDPITAIKAFIQFIRSQPAARLYMIYQTDELLATINEIIGSDALAKESIKLVGKIPHSQLQSWYNAADFIISGSHYEGSGVAVSEAMSCGCIPIVTEIASFRKMTDNGKCGRLYPAGNDKALLEILLQTTHMDLDKEKAMTLKQFTKELSFDAIAKKINRIIQS